MTPFRWDFQKGLFKLLSRQKTGDGVSCFPPSRPPVGAPPLQRSMAGPRGPGASGRLCKGIEDVSLFLFSPLFAWRGLPVGGRGPTMRKRRRRRRRGALGPRIDRGGGAWLAGWMGIPRHVASLGGGSRRRRRRRCRGDLGKLVFRRRPSSGTTISGPHVSTPRKRRRGNDYSPRTLSDSFTSSDENHLSHKHIHIHHHRRRRRRRCCPTKVLGFDLRTHNPIPMAPVVIAQARARTRPTTP
jgi:hypothetical protein